MQRLICRLGTRARQFWRKEDGASTIPAVMFLPFFIILMFSGVELGVLMLRQTLMDRGVDMSVRLLRLGAPMPTHEQLKRSICSNIGFIPNCMNDLSVEIYAVDKATWTSSQAGTSVTCIDRAATEPPPPTTLERGASDQLMLLRACLKVDPMMPTTGLGGALTKTGDGSIALIVTTAFVNEPRKN
ncbi:TadE/TadG family type IV pilus assembly protein [Phaeovulum sp.]|uniref:TadE/TadG family type IV pilus assembly protein n=1 Tax=Phaeovulum sp. TaxID=2934796 RepID=UPI0039E6AB0A